MGGVWVVGWGVAGKVKGGYKETQFRVATYESTSINYRDQRHITGIEVNFKLTCLLFGAICGVHCHSCDFTGLEKPTLEKQIKLGNGTYIYCAISC